MVLNTFFLLIISTMYYYYQKNIFTELRYDSMLYYAGNQQHHIFSSQSMDELVLHLGRDPRFAIAFLDSDRHILYASEKTMQLPTQTGFSQQDDEIYYIDRIELEHLKQIAYIVIRASSITPQLDQTRHSIYLFLLFSILFFSALIYPLSVLFLQPVRDAISKLDRFIRDTTHELNTPISVITMSIEQLDKAELEPKQSKHIERINVASRTLSHLYKDLTFLMMHNNAQSVPDAIDMRELVAERIEYFRPLAESKKITVRSTLSPCTLHIDQEKISRVIDNLLSNAIKYNKPSGTLEVTLNEYALSVRDTGIGIPEEQRENIFNRYSRFDDANGGFGIGLNIVKSVCDESGFEIEVDSIVSEGSVFTIRWGKSSH